MYPFLYFRRLANTKGEIRVGVSHQVKNAYLLIAFNDNILHQNNCQMSTSLLHPLLPCQFSSNCDVANERSNICLNTCNVVIIMFVCVYPSSICL